MKKILLIIGLLFIVTSCNKDNNSFVVGTSSNLLNENDRKELKEIFKKNNMSNIDLFFSWLDDYNKESDNGCGLKDWTKVSDLKYDDNSCIERYEKNHAESDGNCRITSYTLLSDLISVSKKENDIGSYLMFDEDVIMNNKDYLLIKENYDEFITVFNEIDVTNVKKDDIKDLYNKKWKNYGIKLDSDNVSLITILIHDSDLNVLFVGHAGILISLSDKLIFVEKIAFLYPYQVTIFNNLDELKDMLFKRSDYLSYNEEEVGPFIYQNDKLIYSYK